MAASRRSLRLSSRGIPRRRQSGQRRGAPGGSASARLCWAFGTVGIGFSCETSGPADTSLGGAASGGAETRRGRCVCIDPALTSRLAGYRAWLIGHELAHAVQQRQGRVRNPTGLTVGTQMLEGEADCRAHRVWIRLWARA
jgi:hypothetical protein